MLRSTALAALTVLATASFAAGAVAPSATDPIFAGSGESVSALPAPGFTGQSIDTSPVFAASSVQVPDNLAAVPEPATMIGLGLAALALRRKRKAA